MSQSKASLQTAMPALVKVLARMREAINQDGPEGKTQAQQLKEQLVAYNEILSDIISKGESGFAPPRLDELMDRIATDERLKDTIFAKEFLEGLEAARAVASPARTDEAAQHLGARHRKKPDAPGWLKIGRRLSPLVLGGAAVTAGIRDVNIDRMFAEPNMVMKAGMDALHEEAEAGRQLASEVGSPFETSINALKRLKTLKVDDQPVLDEAKQKTVDGYIEALEAVQMGRREDFALAAAGLAVVTALLVVVAEMKSKDKGRHNEAVQAEIDGVIQGVLGSISERRFQTEGVPSVA